MCEVVAYCTLNMIAVRNVRSVLVEPT